MPAVIACLATSHQRIVQSKLDSIENRHNDDGFPPVVLIDPKPSFVYDAYQKSVPEKLTKQIAKVAYYPHNDMSFLQAEPRFGRVTIKHDFSEATKSKSIWMLLILLISFLIMMYHLTWIENQWRHRISLRIDPQSHQIPTSLDLSFSDWQCLNCTELSLSDETEPEEFPDFSRVLRKNFLIIFIFIIFIVSLICEKVFAYRITIRTADYSFDYHNHHSQKNIPNDLIISLIYFLPWRLISRIWGFINKIPLPVSLRMPIYNFYARIFGCKLEEIETTDLTKFSNLSQFFRRSLKPDLRPISQENGVLSPADGLIVQFEHVPKNGGYIGSVKGIHYSIFSFLGPNTFETSFYKNWALNDNKIKPGHCLYTCAIYLAPGDYHRFHSPVNWIIDHRRHFTGNLLSVKPSFVSKFPNLFAINERVAYYGRWKYGFFSMTAVGATNVGSVKVLFDQDLRTNQINSYTDCMQKTFKESIHMKKGELFGEFDLGSTMVMIFEAPNEYVEFESSVQQKINYGQLLFRIKDALI